MFSRTPNAKIIEGKSGILTAYVPRLMILYMKDELGLSLKLAYGSGDLGFSITTTMVGAYLSIFLTDVVGLAPTLVATAIFIGRSVDYINDPIIGHLVDRTRSRWGRRRPYLLFGALPFGATFLLLWLRPPLNNPALLAAYYGGAYALFDTAATFVYMPYYALTPEIAPSYDQRTSLTSFRMSFSIIGSLIVFVLPWAFIGSFSPDNADRILVFAVGVAIISVLPLFICFAAVNERPEFQKESVPNLKDSLKAAFGNRAFLFGAVIFLATWVCIDLLQALIVYYIKHVIQRESYMDLIMALIFVTALISIPLWNFLSGLWDKRLAYIVGAAFLAICLGLLSFLGATTSMGVIAVLSVAAGIGVGAAHVIPWSILPDAVELDEYETGERHEGMFYSLITLAQKAASSIALPLVLLMLGAAGYAPRAEKQSESAIRGIRLVMSIIPALLLGSGAIFALKYPLKREDHKRLTAELDERRRNYADVQIDPAEAPHN